MKIHTEAAWLSQLYLHQRHIDVFVSHTMDSVETESTEPDDVDAEATQHSGTNSETSSVLDSVRGLGSSRGSGKSSAVIISRLRNEVMVLKDALDKLNGQDVTFLMAKLRGTKDDLISMKQKNNELKDRVQVLELKLFDALSYNQQVLSKKKSKSNNNSDNQPINELDDSDSTKISAATHTASLELRYQQLQQLNAQLEYKVRELQAKEKSAKSKILKSNVTIDPNGTKAATAFVDKLVANVGLGVTLEPSSLSSLQKILVDLSGDDRTNLLQIWKESLTSLQDANKKTIYELANEVKNLSTTLADFENNKQQRVTSETNTEIKRNIRHTSVEPVISTSAKESTLVTHIYSVVFGVVITILTIFWRSLIDQVKKGAAAS